MVVQLGAQLGSPRHFQEVASSILAHGVGCSQVNVVRLFASIAFCFSFS